MPMFLLAVMSLLFAQTPSPANPACSLLTTAQITSLIGAARTVPVSAAPMGSSCMLTAGDKILTVLIVNNNTPDGATRQFESKKLMMSGQSMPGWTLPSYAGNLKSAAIVGFLNGLVLTELKMADPAQAAEAMLVKLQAVAKDVAGRK